MLKALLSRVLTCICQFLYMLTKAHRSSVLRTAYWAIPVGIALASTACLGAQAKDSFDFALRPALQATSYIRVLPDPPLSSQFVELIRNGVHNAPSVNAAAARWQAARQGALAAEAAGLPSASLYGDTGLATGLRGNTPYSYGVRISMPIFDGNSAALGSAAQNSQAAAAQSGARDELASTLIDLVAAAGSVHLADDTLGIRQAQRGAIEKLLSQIAADRTAGDASKVDTDQVEQQLVQIDLEIDLARADRAQAIQNFAAIAGRAPAAFPVSGSLSRYLPRDLRAATAIALANNPRLSVSQNAANAARLSQQATAAALGPNLSLDADIGNSGDVMSGTQAFGARAMFRFQVPLSFGAEPQVRQKHYETQAADFQVAAAQNGIVAGVSGAIKRLEATRSALMAAIDAQERSKTLLSGIATERELGERSVFDQLNAQSGQAESALRVAQLTYQLSMAEHLLAAQTGQIAGIYGVEIGLAR